MRRTQLRACAVALWLGTFTLPALADNRDMQFGGQDFDSVGLMFTLPFGGHKQEQSLFHRAQPAITLGLAQFQPPERLCEERCAARPVLLPSYQIGLDSIIDAATSVTVAPLRLDLSRIGSAAGRSSQDE